MPQSSDEQGLVALICNKKLEEMTKVGENNIQQAIHKILGGQNNIQVCHQLSFKVCCKYYIKIILSIATF